MQHVICSREQFYDAVVFESLPVDVSGMAMLVLGVTVHAISGTTPQLSAQLQTSTDLETWADVGSPVDVTATGWSGGAVVASSTPYGRYVRVEYTVTGSGPLVNATVAINVFRET